MTTINVTTQIKRSIDLEVDIYDVIEAINCEPMSSRFNFIAQLLNGIETGKDKLTETQVEVIREYLERKIKLFGDNE